MLSAHLFRALLLGSVVGSSVGMASTLFQYNGKSYSAADLSPAAAQQVFDIDQESYMKKQAALDDAVLSIYFEEEAAKRKKPVKEVEADLLKVKDPTEKETKAFYDENKARIPYPYDQIKEEVKKILISQKKNEARTKLVEKVRKDKKVVVTLQAPEAIRIALRVDGFPTKGEATLPVHVVEFADYQCPHCKHASEAFKKLMNKYGKNVRLTFVDFPINPSGISRIVAQGSHCAAKQNKYWEYHYMAFDNQAKLTDKSPEEFAKKLGLNESEFKTCAASDWAKAEVERGRLEGERVGVSGTPTIYINGKKFVGGHSEEGVEAAIQAELKQKAS